MYKFLFPFIFVLVSYYVSAQNKNGTSYVTENDYQNSAKTYSIENLQFASTEELEYYHHKAEELCTFGTAATIFGSLVLGTAFLIGDTRGIEGPVIALLTGTSGLITMVIGIPMMITGKKRIKRINSIKNNASIDFGINVQPCAQCNLTIQNYQPRAMLNIYF